MIIVPKITRKLLTSFSSPLRIRHFFGCKEKYAFAKEFRLDPLKWQKLFLSKSEDGNDSHVNCNDDSAAHIETSEEGVLFSTNMWEDLDLNGEKYCHRTSRDKRTLIINGPTRKDCGRYRLQLEYKCNIIKHIEFSVKARGCEVSSRILVVAIDIGTTYSRYAFQLLNDSKSEKRQGISASSWKANIGKSKRYSKTPTTLLLNPDNENNSSNSFGYEAEEIYLELTERSKLQKGETVNDNSTVKDTDGHPLLLRTIFKQSINYIKNHFDANVKSETDPKYIQWVLTIPGTWKASAKSVLRNAAEEAGIPSNNLQLTLESNAALLYCNYFLSNTLTENHEKNRNPVLINNGTCFMILDLGGTTIDVTVYEITGRDSFRKRYLPTKSIPESINVLSAYIKLLKSIFGSEMMTKFQTERKADLLELQRDLELNMRQIKDNFGPSVPVPFPKILFESIREQTGRNVEDIISNSELAGKITVERGQRITIARQEFEKFFDGLKKHIIHHLKEVLGKQQRISSVLMVGGLSEISIIVNAMKAEFPEVRFLVPPAPANAIVMGAVLSGWPS